MEMLEIGKAEVLREGSDVALLSLGHTALDGAEAAERAAQDGVSVCHIDLRWAKPLDEQMLHRVGREFSKVVTVEDGVVGGGVGSAVLEWFADHGYAPQVKRLGIGDEFVEHGTVAELKALCGYDCEGIYGALVKDWNK